MNLSLAVVASLIAWQATSWTDQAAHRVQLVSVSDAVQLELLDYGGNGRPVVLLAGLGNTAHVFDEFAPKLSALGHIYALTRRGFGASSRPESGYDVARLGEDVLAVMDTLRLEPAILVGHSIAGQELSYLATRHRERIAGLVYLDAAYRYAYDVPGEFEKEFAALPKPPATPPAVSKPPFTLPEAERRQPRGLPETSKAVLAGGQQFSGIGVPALAIFASPHDTGAAVPSPEFDAFDEAMTERQARAFERGVPGARVLRWARASHYLWVTREAEVIKEVSAFISALR